MYGDIMPLAMDRKIDGNCKTAQRLTMAMTYTQKSLESCFKASLFKDFSFNRFI